MHQFTACLFVYLFPIQISTATRNALKAPYLLIRPWDKLNGTGVQLPALREKIVKHIFISWSPGHHFDSTCRQTLVGVHRFWCLKTLKATEKRPGHVLRGTACNDLPCGRRLSLYFRWGPRGHFKFIIEGMRGTTNVLGVTALNRASVATNVQSSR